MTKLNQTQIDALPVAEQIAYYKAYNAQLEAEKKSGGVISFKVRRRAVSLCTALTLDDQ